MAEGGQNEGRDHRSQPKLPRRGFPVAIAAIAVFAAVVTVAGAFSAGQEPVRHAAQGIVAGVTSTPDTATTAPTVTEAPDVPSAVIPTTGPTAAAEAPTSAPTGTATPTATPATSSASVTPTVDEAWSATPISTTPEPTGPLDAQAGELIADIQARYGVRILVEGQYWGDTAADQLRNQSEVNRALESVPPSLLAAVNNNAGGVLTLASNNGGRTEDGWQPYGDRAANFYCNEDRGPNGRRAANQIVLQPGSAAQTIAHEIMHAFQLHGQAPGDYVSALLTPEMRSFMAATGWTQLVSDDEVRANAGSWTAINSLYSYTGRDTSYVNEYGTPVSLYAPNPLEAFAEAGGLYYAHSDATTLPDWAEYWGWFAANVG